MTTGVEASNPLRALEAYVRRPPPEARRLVAFGSAWVVGLLSAASLYVVTWGVDARVYWSAWQVNLYGATGPLSGYVYSPAFAQAIAPLTQLPWPEFQLIWCALAFGAYAWLLAPVQLRLRVPLLVACALPALNGNIEWLVALVLVMSFRYPTAWAVLLLTKITPGVGLLWFAVRREWRALSIALGATAVIAMTSFASSPALWTEWVSVLARQVQTVPGGFAGVGIPDVPLVVRLGAAALLVAWAARAGHAWLLAPAVALANPDLWIASLGVLAAIPRLHRSGVGAAHVADLTPTETVTG